MERYWHELSGFLLLHLLCWFKKTNDLVLQVPGQEPSSSFNYSHWRHTVPAKKTDAPKSLKKPFQFEKDEDLYFPKLFFFLLFFIGKGGFLPPEKSPYLKKSIIYCDSFGLVLVQFGSADWFMFQLFLNLLGLLFPKIPLVSTCDQQNGRNPPRHQASKWRRLNIRHQTTGSRLMRNTVKSWRSETLPADN